MIAIDLGICHARVGLLDDLLVPAGRCKGHLMAVAVNAYGNAIVCLDSRLNLVADDSIPLAGYKPDDGLDRRAVWVGIILFAADSHVADLRDVEPAAPNLHVVGDRERRRAAMSFFELGSSFTGLEISSPGIGLVPQRVPDDGE